VLQVNSGQTLTLNGAGDAFAGAVSGSGTLAVTGGATSFNAGAALTIAKVAESNGATVTVNANLSTATIWTQSASTVVVTTGKTLTFTGAGCELDGSFTGLGALAFNGGSDRLTGTTLGVAQTTITGAKVILAGTVVNSGTITAATSQLLVAGSGATLTGGGHLTLTSAATNKIAAAGAGAVLTNVDNLIQGGGQLGGGTLGLVNQAGGKISGNAAVALVIDAGASTIANAGTIAASGAGGVEIKSAIANTGVLTAAGGTLKLDRAVSGAGTAKINAGTLVAAAAFTEDVAFAGLGGVLQLAHSQAYAGKISGFSHAGGASLDLRDIHFVSPSEATFSGNASGGTLTVTDGTRTAKIKLVGDYTGSAFMAATDNNGGVTITDLGPHAVHAFVAAVAATPSTAGASPSPAAAAQSPNQALLAHHRG
jgi:hypothetical protein